ncbi:MAG TPA: mycothione reductase [Microbacteriaceae bacterium]|nr:mycothione reductase [Microbacteriaceae bacterium]
MSESSAVVDYDLLVIGAGSGNTLIGPEFDEWSIALVDDGEHFGGTCLNAGCIPTKMFVHVADVAGDAADAARLGWHQPAGHVDWPALRQRIFGRTDAISAAGERYRATECPNVTLVRESVVFEDAHTVVTAGGRRLRGRVVVVAAGSRPRPLTAPHDDDPAIYDSDSIMRIDQLPASMIIAGGGAVAMEFAHVFSSFGVRVTIVNRSPRLLRTLDDEVSRAFTDIATRRWHVHAGSPIVRVARDGAQLDVVTADGAHHLAESLLVAQGRIPNTDRLGLAPFFDVVDGRLSVDDAQRAQHDGAVVPGVYALGDICSAYELKHVANHQARLVRHNITHPDAPHRGNPGPVPAAIFSHPQVAHFGLTEAEALRRYGRDHVVTARYDYAGTAYGWAFEDTTGFCKLVVSAPDGAILGAHLIGPQASILLQPLIQAAALGRGVRGLARAQYWPHPAAVEVVENALLHAEEALGEAADGEG